MKILKFNVPAKLKNTNGIMEVILDHTNQKELGSEGEEFDSNQLVLKSQEIAEFNRNETEVIKSFREEGDYNCEFKIIIE